MVNNKFSMIPFGLNNAPSTFQTLMNEVFRPLLGKFVLVFFDDILTFNKSWFEHMKYLETVFFILQLHKLYV